MEQEQTGKVKRFIKMKEIVKRTGLSRQTIYNMYRIRKSFPAPVISECGICLGWIEEQVIAWQEGLVKNQTLSN